MPVEALVAPLVELGETVTLSLGLPATLTVCEGVATSVGWGEGVPSTEGVTSMLSVGATVTVCVPVFLKTCV